MIKKLFPDRDLDIRRIETEQPAKAHVLIGHVIRQKRKCYAIFQHGADKRCVADLQDRINSHGSACQGFVQDASVAHAFFCEDKWPFEQLINRDAAVSGERMAGGGYEVACHRFLRGDHVVSVINMIIQRVDKICFIAVEHAEHFFCTGLKNLQGQMGKKTAKFVEPVFKKYMADRGGHCDTDTSSYALRAFSRGLHRIGCAYNLMSELEDLKPLGSQADRVVHPVKEGDAQLAFQLLDLQGDGGLRITELRGSLCKASLLCRLDKAFQISDFHNITPLKIFMLIRISINFTNP